MVAVAVSCRKGLINARWAILAQTGLKKRSLHLVGVPFLTFQPKGDLSGQRALTIECLLMGGCGQSHELACGRSCGSSFQG